jgi:hypothetical protein
MDNLDDFLEAIARLREFKFYSVELVVPVQERRGSVSTDTEPLS